MFTKGRKQQEEKHRVDYIMAITSSLASLPVRRLSRILCVLQTLLILSSTITATAFVPSNRWVSVVKSFSTKHGSIQVKPWCLSYPTNTNKCTQSNDNKNTLLAMSMLDNNNIEVGIQTAQLLMDRKRHDNLKKKMKKQFPLVPDVVLDSTIDMVAQTFTKVAPEKLKLALQPGGMDQVRPEMEFIIVQYTLKHPLFEGIPIFNNVDKRRLVEAIVSRALDYVLQDARQVLAAPEVRLETLEEQLTEIKALMGPKRLFMYRVRHNYKRIAIFAAIALVSTAIYQQRNVPAVVQLLALPSTISNQFTAITTWASAKFSIICYTVRSKLSALSTATKKLVAR